MRGLAREVLGVWVVCVGARHRWAGRQALSAVKPRSVNARMVSRPALTLAGAVSVWDSYYALLMLLELLFKKRPEHDSIVMLWISRPVDQGNIAVARRLE